MKELSLNILDITENSVKAGATLTEISIIESGDTLTLTIKDDGCGMSEEMLSRVCDPFTTSRTTRKVGLGLPLFKQSAESTGGSFCISSVLNKGTEVTATFKTDNIDCMPMGDIISTVCILVAGSPEVDFVFTDETEQRKVSLDTRELRAVLGEDISLAEPEIQTWMSEYLKEQYENQTEI